MRATNVQSLEVALNSSVVENLSPSVSSRPSPDGAQPAGLVLQPEASLADAPESFLMEDFGSGAATQIAPPLVTSAPQAEKFTKAAVQPLVQQTVEPVLELAKNASPDETRMLRFTLNPAEMGRVEVEVTRDANGRVSASLTAEQADTAQALTHGIGQLRESLERAGLVVEQLQVTTQTQSQTAQQFGQQTGQQPSQQHAPHNLKADSLPPDPLIADGTTPASENKLLSLHA